MACPFPWRVLKECHESAIFTWHRSQLASVTNLVWASLLFYLPTILIHLNITLYYTSALCI